MTDVLESRTSRARPKPPPSGRRAFVVVLVLAIVGTAVGAWLIFRDTSPSEPAAFDSSCGTVVHAEASKRLTVLLIGDSILAQPSCELGRALAPAGVETHMHAVPGSGLLTDVDKSKRTLDRLLVSVKPDVVLALYIGNYIGPPVLDLAGNPVAKDSPLFDALWQQRAAEISKEVHDAGGTLYWIEPPPMNDGGTAQRLFQGYESLGDPVLHSGRALAGPSGGWVAALPSCVNGEPLRTPDGVHLSPAGIHVFALAIAHDLAGAEQLPAVAPAC